jgi:bacteriorhodopsin
MNSIFRLKKESESFNSMEGYQIVRNSTIISLVVQIITGIIGGAALFVPLGEKDKILGDILGFEMAVQFVELVFYFWFLFLKDVATITTTRYFDWFLSTPVMLLTMAAYFSYESLKEKFRNESIRDFFAENKRTLYAIFLFNFLMLLAGLLGELGYVTKLFAFLYGFVALLLSFGTIYKNFVFGSDFVKGFFGLMAITWSGYGVTYMFDPVKKNVAYTILDIIAKNFFGLYLGFKIFQMRS